MGLSHYYAVQPALKAACCLPAAQHRYHMADMVASVKQRVDNTIDLRPDSRMPAPFQQRQGARGRALSERESTSGWSCGHPQAQGGTREVQAHQWHEKI